MVYNLTWLDTKNGPLVIELPPKVLGLINDFRGRYVADMGRAGPDRGAGGKYLLLPPDHSEPVPDGYFVLHSPTYGNHFLFRSFLENGDPRPAVENTKRHFRVYPLDRVANPPDMTFMNISGVDFNTVPATDVSFFENIATVVQEEPLDAIDPETRGLLAAIGIRKDKPFAPDARMQGILADAAAVGTATGRALVFHTRSRNIYYYPDSTWKTPWGTDYEFSPGGVLDLDIRERFHFLGWGVSPAMTVKMVGVGSQYAVTEHDAGGQYLDGGKTYQLHLPAEFR